MTTSLHLPRLPQLAGLEVGSQVLVEKDGELTDLGLCALAAVTSALFCAIVYKLGRYISPVLFPCYRKLSLEDQRNWDTRYSSMVHSYLTVQFAISEMLMSDYFFKPGPVPTVLRTTPVTYLALGISLGYFVVDLLCCLKYNLGGSEMVAHHIGSLSSVIGAILSGQCHLYALWMLVTEFTTPCVNLRWWLDRAEAKEGTLYLVNGGVLTLSWFVARILTFPPFFYIVWTHRHEWHHLWLIAKVLLTLFPIVLTTLNLFWFYKIMRGALKLFGLGPKKAAAEPEKED